MAASPPGTLYVWVLLQVLKKFLHLHVMHLMEILVMITLLMLIMQCLVWNCLLQRSMCQDVNTFSVPGAWVLGNPCY